MRPHLYPRRLARTIAWLVLMAPLLWVLCMCTLYVWQVLPRVRQEAIEASIAWAQKEWHTPILVGEVFTDLLRGKVTVRNVFLGDPYDPQKPLVAAREVTVSELYSRRPDIHINAPVARAVRLPDGRWNFSRLLPKRRAPAETFWTVRITNGILHFEDHKAHPTLRATLQQVEGEVRSTAGVTTFDFTHGQASPNLKARTTGWLYNGQWRLRVNASDVPVSTLMAYTNIHDLDATRARATGTVWVYTDAQQHIRYMGKAIVQAAQARWKSPQGDITLSNLYADTTFGTGVATGRGHARAGSGQVFASGTVQWQPQAVVDLVVDAQKIPPSALRQWVRRYAPQIALNAPVDARLALRGTLAQPRVQGEVHTARARVGHIEIQEIRTKVILNPQFAFLRDVYLKVGDGSVQGQVVAWKHGKEWQIGAHWKADKVNLARLRPYLPGDIGGVVHGEGLVSGFLRRPSVVMNLRGERLAGNLWRSEHAQARIRWTPDTLHIDGAVLEDWSGAGYISGTVDLKRKQMALRVRADEVLLAPWVERLAPKLRHEGDVPSAWVYAQGELTGTFRQPVFRGVVEATDLQWRRWSLDYLVARVEASPDRVQVTGGIIRRPPMEVTWQGELQEPLDPEKARVWLSGVANNVDAQEVLSALREPATGEEPLPVEAIGRAFFHVEGKLRAPVADVTVSVPMAQLRNWNLTAINGAVRYEDGLLKVSSLSARLGDGILKAQGERDSTGRLSFQIVGDNLPLAQIRALLPEDAPQDISGEVFVQGAVTGSEQEPQFDGEITIRNAVWDVLRAHTSSAQVRWRQGELSAQNIRTENPEFSLNIGSLYLSDMEHTITAEGTLSVASLEALSRKVMDSAWLRDKAPRLGEMLHELGGISGTAMIPFRLRGETKSPSVEASLELQSLEINESMLGTLRAQIGKDSAGVWRLQNAVLSNGEHRLIASGTYGPEGEVNLSAEAYNFDLAWFQRWLPKATELRGKVEMAAVEVSGKSDSPDVVLTLALKEPQFGAVRAERVLSGKVQVSRGKLDISEIVLAQKDGQVRIWGTLPFHWEPFGVPDTEPINVHAEASPQPLSALLAYLPSAGIREADGQWSLKATLAGTRSAPQLSGEMLLSANSFRIAQMRTGLRDVQASVQFQNEAIRLTELTAVGDSPRGGRIIASGEVRFGGEGQERIDARLRLERFWLEERNLSGQYGEQIRAFLDGELRFAGSAENPQLSGAIVASGGAFVLPASFPEQKAEARPLPINPQFENVVLRVGEGMWLNSPRLSTQAEGEIVLSGSLQEPIIHGQLGLERGYVYFPTARFRLEPGGFITVDYPVPGDNPFRVNVNVQANTNLSITSPTGDVRRYRVTVVANGAVTSPEGLRTEFRSDPPDLSTQRIARALGVGTLEEILAGRNMEQVLQREVVNLFTSAYVPQLFSPLERGIEEVLQLREFRIEYDRYEPITVTLVKRLWDGFSLSYWRTVSAQQERYIVKILYELPEWTRLLRRLRLSLSVDEKQQTFWGIEGSFRF
ncbi:MAG: translocation/assembly module TamB domain-containing protein [Armatimonadota bacterium]